METDKQYLKLVEDVLTNGKLKNDRTGTGTYTKFGATMRFNLKHGFPLLTTKKVNLRSIVHELLWFLRGDTNAIDLDCGIWDSWMVTHKTLFEYFAESEPALHSELWNLVPTAISNKKVDDDWEEYITHNNEQVYVSPDFFDRALNNAVDKKLISVGDFLNALPRLGELGDIYGKMWRAWPKNISLDTLSAVVASSNKETIFDNLHALMQNDGGYIDQIADVVNKLETNPESRRIVVSGWNPALLPDESKSPDRNALDGYQALPPCHTLFQFMAEPLDVYTRATMCADELTKEYGHVGVMNDPLIVNLVKYNSARFDMDNEKLEELAGTLESILDMKAYPEYRLHCQLYQRSADLALGVPFNIASYSLLTMIIANDVNMVPGEFSWVGGDVHIYSNHVEGLQEQLSREPHDAPVVELACPRFTPYGEVTPEDIVLKHYTHHPAINFAISV